MATDEPRFGHVTREDLALFTDLYELAMLQGYRASGHEPEATFSLFVRDLPPDRGYVVAAGLEQVVAYVEALTFSDGALDYLADEGFDGDFLDWLDDWAFTGELRAVPEGTPVFPDEPLLEVTAPITQGQLLETLVINQVGFQSLIATKAARMRDVVRREGDGQQLVDFGSRRAHGTDAGVKAARAAYLGGFAGTSNVAAGRLFDIPVFGTMAHSWIQSFPTERAAFEAFVDVYGEDSILLIDTYDTERGARLAREVAEDRDVTIRGVRIDSGDLAAVSRDVDAIVGDDIDVFVSSGVDEHLLADFFDRDGTAAGFGPGTSLVTSDDAPKLESVYKLVAVDEDGDGDAEPTMKLSAGKTTYPGEKQLYRVADGDGYSHDVLARRDADPGVDGEPLLETVIADGDRVAELPDLDAIASRADREVPRIPDGVRAIRDPDDYPVRVHDGLERLADELAEELGERHG